MRHLLRLGHAGGGGGGWPGQARAPASAAVSLLRRGLASSLQHKPVIGVVGVGKMGSAMASNLLKAGVGKEVIVYDRYNRQSVKALVGEGAIAAASLEEVGRRCWTVVSMLPNDEALTSVTRQLLPQLKPGALHISCSTVSPFTSRALAGLHAKRRVGFVGAPIFARPDGVARKQAYFTVGATDEAAIEQARPILLATGSEVFTFSTEDAGAGNVVKLAGNFLIASSIQSIGEALALAESQGLDRTKVMDMLSSTIFDCLIYRGYGERISRRDHRPGGFSLELGYKDVALVRETAKLSKVPMPFGSLLHDGFLGSLNRGRGEMDWSAVALAISEEAGVKVAAPTSAPPKRPPQKRSRRNRGRKPQRPAPE